MTAALDAAPSPIVDALRRATNGHSPAPDPILSARTDIDLAGDRRPQWLVVTSQLLCVVDDGSTELVLELSLDRAKAFRAYGAVGSGFLQADIDGAWVDLLRYSKGLSDRFTKVAKRLERLRKKEEHERSVEKIDETKCPKCGMPLRFATDVCTSCIDRKALVGRVLDLVRPQLGNTVALFLLLLLGVALDLVPPKLQQYLVDHVLQVDHSSGTEAFVPVLGAIVLSLAAARVLASVIGESKGLLSHRIGTSLTFDLRRRLVEKLHQLPVAFYDRHQVGVLVNRVTHDTEVLHGLIQHLTSGFLLQILQFLGVGIMLFTLNPTLAAYTLIPAPLVVLGSYMFWRYVYPTYYRYWDSTSKQAGALAGMLSGIRVVKSFAQEDRELERFRGSADYLRRSRLAVDRASTTFATVMSLVFSLGGFIVWFVGGKDVVSDEMTLGSLMAFLAYLSMFYAPLSTLAQLTTWLTSFMTASQRIVELMDTPIQIVEPTDPLSLDPAGGAIRFENVTFGYERHQPVLDAVTFEIPKGQMVGIVGKSGSGKTTLVNLICRFYDVDEGRITIAGVDVKRIPTKELRKRVGAVLQETFLFRGTVYENLTYGHTDATPEQVIAAAKAASAHDFIMKMPFGYDTAIGERGANLSGGERQRMAIARALVYAPPILIFDEATSSLDTESEKAIQDALHVLSEGRTTIAIAHRLSTLRHADRILVFEKNKLAEDGSHDELLAKEGGIYANLVRMQSRLARGASVDAVEEAKAEEPDKPEPPADRSAFDPVWLDPSSAEITRGDRNAVVLSVRGKDPLTGVVAAYAFPATQRGRYICLRHASGDGPEKEVGILRDLAEWSVEARKLIEEALARRYFVQVIEKIERIRIEFGILKLNVRTKRGPEEVMMRWSQSQAQDHGKGGKILIDVDDNQYLIPDVDALPRSEQWLFRRFIYW
jgi:ATP-binding cassette subfamily B protein